MFMAVSADDVQALYQSLLGRPGATEYVEQYTQYEDLPAVYDAIYNSPEAQRYRETGVPLSIADVRRQSSIYEPIADPNQVFDEDFIDQSRNPYIFGDDGKLIQYTDPNQNPETFADLRNQMGYDHIFALNALNERLKMRAAGDPVGFSQYELRKTGQSESEFNKFKNYVDRLESLYNQGYSINDINALGGGQDVTPSFDETETVAPATTTTTTATTPSVSAGDIQGLYQELLGGPAKPEAIEYWSSQGMSIDQLRNAIANSPEGIQYASTGRVSPERQAYMASLSGQSDGTASTGTTSPTDYSSQIGQYYQELFGRSPLATGSEYWQSQLASGAISPENLQQALISGAQGLDRTYYEATQSGGPLFTATQELFGRDPVRGQYSEEQGRLMGGYDKYRPMYDQGMSDAEIRQQLLDAAYARGEGGGRSADYQAYLSSLGIDRANSPFAVEGGGFANVPYGSDLTAYQERAAQAPAGPQMPNIGGKYGGMGGTGKGGGGTRQTGGTYQAGGGYRMPGQYITGNQLYSGLPYGMTQPMAGGKGGGMGGFGQGMTVPMQPFNYGYSSQYMPNRGLMGGYSTGFGPYGGYQRPRFGGGKGGPRIQPYPYPMNPYAMGGGFG